MNIRKVLPPIALLLLAPVIRAGGGSTLSPGRHRENKGSAYQVRTSLAQGRREWRAGSVHGGLRVVAATRRHSMDRTKRIERILVSFECSSDANHEAGGDAEEHRRCRTDRVRVGNRRSCMDDGAGREDDARVAQGNVSECTSEAGRWGVEGLTSHVG